MQKKVQTQQSKLAPTAGKFASLNSNTSLAQGAFIESGKVSGHMGDFTMSIKQEETIEQILQQTGKIRDKAIRQQQMQSSGQYPFYLAEEPAYELDEDIDKLLRESELKIGEQYDSLARELFAKNRVGISINDEHDRLKQIFDRMDAAGSEISINDAQHVQSEINVGEMSESDKKSERSQPFNLDIAKLNYQATDDWPGSKKHQSNRMRSQSTSLFSFDEQVSSHESISSHSESSGEEAEAKCQKEVQTKQKQSILERFQKQQILQPKQQSLQVWELDQRYPRINISSMYRHQYPIFKFAESSTNKYLRYLRKSMSEIQCALSFCANTTRWTIIAIDGLIYFFVGQQWKQPIIINPRPSRKDGSNTIIHSLSLSKNKTYLSVSLGNQILIYQIKTETNNIVLIKNLSFNNQLNSQLINVSKILIFSENPLKLAYLDGEKAVGLISCEQIMLFSRVSEKKIEHELGVVLDLDVLAMESSVLTNSPGPESKFKFSFNKKITNMISKPKTTYMALSSAEELHLYRIQPSVDLMYHEPLRGGAGRDISVRWRYQQQSQTKPQLLLAQGNTIYIYKLIEQLENGSENIYLQLHLLYENHYDITQMEILSSTHLLLLSNSNIIVIAIPLIPSSDLSQGSGLRKSSGCGQQMFQSAIVFIASEQECRILHTCQDEVLFYSGKAEVLKEASLKSLQQYLDELMLQHGHFREAFTLLILVHKEVNYSFKFSYTKQSLAHSIFSAVEYSISSLRLTVNDDIIKYRLGWICQLLVETNNESMIWTTVYKKLAEKQKEREKEWLSQVGAQEAQTKNANRKDDWEMKSELQRRVLNKQYEKEEKKGKLFSRHSLIAQHTTSSQLRGECPKNLISNLFDILELFILKSQIVSMPEPIFLEFISYQCEKMSDTVVEKAIIQNKEPYDGTKLLNLLQNKERNYLQLYLFSRAIICDEPDFYTPFVKVFASFKGYAEIIEKRKKDVDQEIHKKMKSAGYLCLWYLCKCLKFQKIPSGVMPLNQKLAIIQTMCVQILEPVFTQRLFELDQKVALEILLLLFTDRELSQLIQENNETLVQRYKEYYPSIYQQIMSVPQSETRWSLNRESAGEAGEQIFDKNFKQLFLLHLEKTIPQLNNQKQLWAEFQALGFYYCKTQICLSFEAVVDILIVLFQSKFNAYQLEDYSKQSKKPSVECLELSLIDYIKPVLIQRKDRFYINKLTSFNDRHVSYYLHRIDQNYKQALEQYISAKQSAGLIPFINDLLTDIREFNQNEKNMKQKKILEIKSFLVKNISTLFKIDKFEALNIFYSIGETSQTIYRLIEENMGNKLDFLTAVLKKFEHQDFQMKQKLQLEHLSEVCMLRDRQMLSYLNQFYYPLDSAIIVCQQKGNLLAKAIFQERCGRITQAFLSYERIVKNIIQSNNLPGKLKSEKSIRKKVRKYTEECLRICKQYAYDPNSSPQNNFWLRIITFINGFIKSNNQQKVFLKVEFEKVLQHILTEMFQFLPTTFLTDFFIARGHKLELSMAKEFVIYQNLFILAKFDIDVAKKVLQICKIDIKDTRKQTLFKRKNGVVSQGFCDFCKKPLYEQSTCHSYSCRHSFHKICHDDIYKCLTCYFQSDNSLFKTNIFGAELQRSEAKQEKKQFEGEKKSLQVEKRVNSMQNIHIVVESAELAKQQLIKKKMKIFDYTQEKKSNNFDQILKIYNSKETNVDKLGKIEGFKNEVLKQGKGSAKNQQVTNLC